MKRLSDDDDRLTRVMHALVGKNPTQLLREVQDILTRGAEGEDTLGLGLARMPAADEPNVNNGWSDAPDRHGPGEYAVSNDLAMDSAPASAAGQRELRVAAARCSSILGADAALAYDSAEAVVRGALHALGVREREIHRDALPHVLAAALRGAGASGDPDAARSLWARPAPVVTADDRGFARRFPNAASVRSLG